MKMMRCLNCGALWPVPELSKCENCEQGGPLIQEEVQSSLELALAAYAEASPENVPTMPRVVRSTDVYPLILEELSHVLADKVQFLLYGSAALWLEGKSRPDKGEFQSIKDLDMCAYAKDGIEAAVELLKQLVKGTIVGKIIVWDVKGYVALSNANTLELMSRDHLIQFSFALKTSWDEYNEIATLGALVPLPTRRRTRLPCAGLAFISDGLLKDGGLFRTTLFRSDKTDKILIYACLCIGYGTVGSYNVVQCLVLHLAGASWSEKKAQLTNVSFDRNTKTRTKFFDQTKDVVTKLEQIKSFRVRQDETTYNQVIESNLVQVLQLIAQSKVVQRKEREELVARRLQEALKEADLSDIKELSTRDQKSLMKKIQLQVAQEFDGTSLPKVIEVTIEDATAIWESEVGTGMLIFLTERLYAVRSTISECGWIGSEHRDTILKGHEVLVELVLQELDDRLERASSNSTSSKSPPKTTPPRTSLSLSIPSSSSIPLVNVPRRIVRVDVGTRVRIAYHLHYDVVGTVTATTDSLVTVTIENCFKPGTTEEFRSDHTAIVMKPPGTMSWLWQPNLFAEIYH